MTNKNDRVLLSIDIGGTKTMVSLVSRAGRVLKQSRFPTQVELGPEDLCDRVHSTYLHLQKDAGVELVEGAGISAPGPLSSASGSFLNPPNMPGWHGFPIASALSSRLGLKVELMNDANAAAFAEFCWGAGRGTQTMVFFTMSTGMGAGLVIGSRLHEGIDDLAGEVGHTSVAPDGPVGFGVRGSLEGFCSGPGIAQLAVTRLTQALHAERGSLLFDLEKDWRLIDAIDVGEAAKKGDALARACFEECGEKLGLYCADLVDLLNPEAIVLGTIGRIHQDIIIPAARKIIDKKAHKVARERVKLVAAELSENLPCYAGAAAFISRNDR